ncbi:hypothetical protein GLYMA_20G046300v4 [Glycine max]|uniref:Uncharacterized protein n=1 Tax=Glycine max TaxID=3847 RepID=A0A0R0E7C0_SOYBN|nr:hypothetical protein JHK87_055394 [Glycine soja]KAH1034519.1 hypothetical protein GYH30_054794 [Glycine max]KRG89750.1 hypothetical protein GLYMA_20G046300v4 [Glycine max]
MLESGTCFGLLQCCTILIDNIDLEMLIQMVAEVPGVQYLLTISVKLSLLFLHQWMVSIESSEPNTRNFLYNICTWYKLTCCLLMFFF